ANCSGDIVQTDELLHRCPDGFWIIDGHVDQNDAIVPRIGDVDFLLAKVDHCCDGIGLAEGGGNLSRKCASRSEGRGCRTATPKWIKRLDAIVSGVRHVNPATAN